ncbi:MAG: LytTR family DNA-binding domain-containing protein [Bacteroidota bacterium]
MKVVIIEDEKLSAEHLSLMLTKINKDIEVVKYIDTVKGAIASFNEGLEADLIFLDIHLADGNSFEIFTHIEIDMPIIFTTAFDNYAIQAFKQNSVDYLLKPISLQDLKIAMEKFNKMQYKLNQKLINDITLAYQEVNKQYKNRFLVNKGRAIDYIPVDDICYFETKESLSFLVNTKGVKYPVNYTLDHLESILSPQEFFRINRKIIIKINAIEKVDAYFNSRLIITSLHLTGDERIVSRERVQDFKKWLDT